MVHASEKGFTLVTFGRDMSVRRNKGFTLIESLMVIAILAIVAAIAIPSVQEAQSNSLVRSVSADLVSALAEARSQAIGRQRNISLTPVGGDWRNGWVMSLTVPLAGVPNLAAHSGMPTSIAIVDAPQVDGLVFMPNGQVQNSVGVSIPNVAFQVCDDNVRSEIGRNVWISRVGRTAIVRHPNASICNP